MKRSIDMCGSSKVPYTAEIPLDGHCVVHILPNDVLEFIFSQLDDVGMQSVNLVSKDWSKRAINTCQEEHNRVTCFIKILGKNLLSHENESRKLYAIAEAKGFNTIHIHAEKNRIVDHVLDVIKFLNNEDLAGLEKKSEDIPKPPFFENLFKLAPIYYELDKADKVDDDLVRESKYRVISNRLALCACDDKALKVAQLIKMESTRDLTFKSISLVFAKNGHIAKALEVVSLFKMRLDKSVVRKQISELLIARGDLETAEKVSSDIFYVDMKIMTLKKIYTAYLKIGKDDEAKAIRKVIYPDVVKPVEL